MSVREAILRIVRERGSVRLYDLMDALVDLAFRDGEVICLYWVAWEESGRAVHWCTGAAEELKRLVKEGLVEIVRGGENLNYLVRYRGG